jgi:hypothetical protein
VINFHTNYVAAIDAPDVHEQFREILSKIQAMVAAGETSCVTLSEAAQHLRIGSTKPYTQVQLSLHNVSCAILAAKCVRGFVIWRRLLSSILLVGQRDGSPGLDFRLVSGCARPVALVKD